MLRRRRRAAQVRVTDVNRDRLGLMRPIEEATILVTGATDGLGKGVAAELARDGARVLVHGRDDERGAQTLRELNDQTGNDKLEWWER